MKRLLLLSAFFAACTGELGYRGTATVTATTPDLAYVAPGVSVIADYDEPIFYSDGYYWWNYDGGWYRSSDYTGGWVYASPPRAVLRVGTTARYRHYRPNNYVVRHRPLDSHRIRRPIVRDRRARR